MTSKSFYVAGLLAALGLAAIPAHRWVTKEPSQQPTKPADDGLWAGAPNPFSTSSQVTRPPAASAAVPLPEDAPETQTTPVTEGPPVSVPALAKPENTRLRADFEAWQTQRDTMAASQRQAVAQSMLDTVLAKRAQGQLGAGETAILAIMLLNDAEPDERARDARLRQLEQQLHQVRPGEAP